MPTSAPAADDAAVGWYSSCRATTLFGQGWKPVTRREALPAAGRLVRARPSRYRQSDRWGHRGPEPEVTPSIANDYCGAAAVQRRPAKSHAAASAGIKLVFVRELERTQACMHSAFEHFIVSAGRREMRMGGCWHRRGISLASECKVLTHNIGQLHKSLFPKFLPGGSVFS